jgi:hypothetical protein
VEFEISQKAQVLLLKHNLFVSKQRSFPVEIHCFTFCVIVGKLTHGAASRLAATKN